MCKISEFPCSTAQENYGRRPKDIQAMHFHPSKMAGLPEAALLPISFESSSSAHRLIKRLFGDNGIFMKT